MNVLERSTDGYMNTPTNGTDLISARNVIEGLTYEFANTSSMAIMSTMLWLLSSLDTLPLAPFPLDIVCIVRWPCSSMYFDPYPHPLPTLTRSSYMTACYMATHHVMSRHMFATQMASQPNKV